ncbi:MAG: hypothetical protein ACM3JI_01750 [Anaerolineae bacterium]
MPLLHIANTHFELELIEKKRSPLIQSIESHPIFLQLQFLPFLYASNHDGIAVTHSPPEKFWQNLKDFGINPPHLHLLTEKKVLNYERVESWGYSEQIKQWADDHRIRYQMPPLSIVKLVNSKAFSFSSSPQLPNAKLLYTEAEASNWLEQPGPKVLKTCFGVSGKGHLILEKSESTTSPRVRSFLNKEFGEQLPVIAEPWVSRLLDFSTQWMVHSQQHIQELGAVLCKNTSKGSYVSTIAGSPQKLFGSNLSYLEEHRNIAKDILKKMARLGYFGPVGIDAMLYVAPDGQTVLQPIVEINARKTMGWVALHMHLRYFPLQTLELTFSSPSEEEKGLLPQNLSISTGSLVSFQKQLYIRQQERLL